jgi:gliding motility associated protien GldN
MIKRLILVLVCLFAGKLFSQGPTIFDPGDYKDGVYDKENSINKRVIPYTHLREGDVTWEKRVWRNIDMREKVNHPLYFPVENIVGRTSLFQVLAKNILNGNLLAFGNDEFIVPLEPAAIRDKIKKCDSIKEEGVDAEGNVIETSRWECDSTSIYRKIRSYKLKEDWFFDKQKSVLEVRVIGIGVFTYDEDKEAEKEEFWVYYPACRPLFARSEVYNTKNDSERRTFEDIFWKRQFNSTVVKETNVFNRNIQEYAKGIDALLESDRIKGDIFRWEHDLWQF